MDCHKYQVLGFRTVSFSLLILCCFTFGKMDAVVGELLARFNICLPVSIF